MREREKYKSSQKSHWADTRDLLQRPPRGVAKAFVDLGGKDHQWAQQYAKQCTEREESTKWPQKKTPGEKRQYILHTVSGCSIYLNSCHFLLDSNNSVSWLYYVLLATVLKLFYNSGKKRHLRNLSSKPPVRLKKVAKANFLFPFYCFPDKLDRGCFRSCCKI